MNDHHDDNVPAALAALIGKLAECGAMAENETMREVYAAARQIIERPLSGG